MNNNSIYQTFFKTYIDLDKVVSMAYYDEFETPIDNPREDFKIIIICQLLEKPIEFNSRIHLNEWINTASEWDKIIEGIGDQKEERRALLQYFKKKYFDTRVSDWMKYKNNKL